MKKNTLLKNIFVEKLVFWWKWFARLKSENPDLDNKAIFISGGVIPESMVDVKVLRSRKDYIETQLLEVTKKSPFEITHPNNPYGMQAGTGWVNIPYEKQLQIKENQVKEALFHIEKLQNPLPFSPIIPSPLQDNYRNKIEFSFGKFISQRYEKNEHFNVWFHKQWEFSKIEDFDGTILISKQANQIYKEIKDFAKASGYPVYDQFTQEWFFRHIVLREAFFTSQMMIIFSINHTWEWMVNDEIWIMDELKKFFDNLAKRYPIITSIYLSLNNNKADIAIGELKLIYGKKNIQEKLLWLIFNISPKSFFQTNSHWAEILYSQVLNQIQKDTLQEMTILDLYGWTWTIGMLFAKYAKNVISVEMIESASKDGMENAKKNNLKNIKFINAKVEDFLKEYLEKKSVSNKEIDRFSDTNNKTSQKCEVQGKKDFSDGVYPDINDEEKSAFDEEIDRFSEVLVIDPPRNGMHPDALPNILKFDTRNIIYVSCNPATLSRDLEYILKNSKYKIKNITPIDMFPHTSHIETIVLLEK